MDYRITMTNGTELYHHGVKGQKWGVRNYQNEDGSYKPGAEGRYYNPSGRKTAVGQYFYYGKKSRDDQTNKALDALSRKKYGEAASHLLGNRAIATTMKNYSEYSKERASQSKTRLARQYHRAASYNRENFAKYFEKRANRTIGERILNSFYDVDYWNKMPVKTLSGRTTTLGNEAVLSVLTGGAGPLVLDALYTYKQGKGYKEEKNNLKQVKNEAIDKAYNKYDKQINDLEKKYSKGQNLTDDDVKKEADYENDYRKAESEAKAKYEEELRKIKDKYNR